MIQNTIYRSDFPIELIESTGTDDHFEPIIFRINAPMFVWSELRRHQSQFGYNGQADRSELVLPEFYIPSDSRPLVPNQGIHSYIGTKRQQDICVDTLIGAYDQAWYNYQHQLKFGINPEVARMCLPEATYTTLRLTCDPYSLLDFLSMVHKSKGSFDSYPQWEIIQIAEQMESIFRDLYRNTHDTYLGAGRVAP